MNRIDFMRQLESLLQNIAPNEREEALQYYNDYFDDAGKENEQEVIEALGNPARVAESIRKDLLGGGYGESTARKALASDRALMKYGEGDQSEAKESVKDDNGAVPGYGQETRENAFAEFGQNGQNTVEANPFYTQSQNERGNVQNWGEDVYEEPARSSGMPAWAVALIVTLLVLGSPVILGIGTAILGVLVAAAAAWFGLLFTFGAVSLSMLAVLAVLVIVGFMCIPANPWVGMTLIGGGLICGAIGILFLMLTVAVGGVVPAIIRGLASLIRRKKAVRG